MTYDPIPQDSRDLHEALSDLIVLRGGFALDDPHPAAEAMRHGHVPLQEIAARLFRLPPGAPPGELSRALTHSDFGDALATGLNRIISIGYGSAAQGFDTACLDLPTKGLYPVQTPVLDLGELSDDPTEAGRLVPIDVSEGETVTPRIYGWKFLASRALLLGDGDAILAAWTAQMGGHCARMVPRMIGAVLTTNAALADGTALLTTSNTTSATGLDLTALAEASAILRNATTPVGNILGARPGFLMVPPSKEMPARVLLASMAKADDPPIRLLVNPWQPSDSYLLANTADAAVFGRVFPSAWGKAPRIERVSPSVRRPDGNLDYYDGQAFRAEIALGVQPIGRLGIVKIPAS